MIRLDDAGLAALLDAGRAGSAAVSHPGVDGALGPTLDVLRDALVELDLVVAGTSRLVHRVRVAADRAVVLLGVQPNLHQVLLLPPSHVAAALVRMTCLRPRRTGERQPRPYPLRARPLLVDPSEEVRLGALADAGASWAWQLEVSAGGERREVTAVDGDDGLFLADGDVLLPVSNTTAYRIFSTALPAATLASDEAE